MPYLLLLPLFVYAEVSLFLWVAGMIGWLPALLLSLAAAIMGSALIRAQGFAALTRLKGDSMHKDMPHELTGRNLFDAACLAVAGLFFIVPGFLTDILALLLLLPGVRKELYASVTAPHGMTRGTPRPRAGRHGRDPDVIEGEYTRLDE